MSDPLARVLEQAGLDHFDAEAQRAVGKRVLLVEGHDDRLFIEAILNERDSTWATSVAVIACNGRSKVLRALDKQRLPYGPALHYPAIGLVDRDTWTNSEVAAQPTSLHVTEGWCAENAFFTDLCTTLGL